MPRMIGSNIVFKKGHKGGGRTMAARMKRAMRVAPILSFITVGSVLLLQYLTAPLIEARQAQRNTAEASQQTSLSMEAEKLVEMSDFQFSKFCQGAPLYFTNEDSFGQEVAITQVVNDTTNQSFTASLKVSGADLRAVLVWNTQNVRILLEDINGQILDSRESTSYDPRGKPLAVGFASVNEMLVFLIPETYGQVGYAIVDRSSLIEQSQNCP